MLRMNDFEAAYRVPPATRPSLAEVDPRDASLFPAGKEGSVDHVRRLSERIATLQEMLFAQRNRKVLVLLQGMDTSGKDGTVRHVLSEVNSLGIKVVSFKAPTAEELSHDFLWRVHAKVPGAGEFVVFNRSHYEDVLIARVRELVPESVWRPRFQRIREFETLLATSGTTILKFFLHISRDEQRERLQARVDDPAKRWKFNRGDLEERRFWDDYQRAYEEAIAETSTEESPWFVIPADRKWYRNVVIAEIVTARLDALGLSYPEIDLRDVVVE
jgi:PPK2 family polyphosphate:nucleotide phosphotransferase